MASYGATLKQHIPPPWVLVLIGLVLNVMAILVSSLVLDSINQNISALKAREAQNQYAITLDWNSVETLERKREVTLLHMHLANLAPANPKITQSLIDQLQLWTSTMVSELSVETVSEVMLAIDQSQQQFRNRIDSHYLDNLEVAEQVQSWEEKLVHYKNIALFLQIFGLALILARDLAR
ncbi:DNA mismatch repair protein [Vibrio sp. WXL210]|uniref:DNA mismatch repair protein n=1 Tax=Vibrio sp. WXL210 TaxID=3450709 RepID=UPI003EC4DC45